MTSVTRVYRFAASHRLHSPLLSDERNREVYGKCDNPYGHGHDYVLQVGVSGAVPETGVLCNVEALDGYVEDKLLRWVRDRNLNDWEEFGAVVPTTENLAMVALRRLSDGWRESFPAGPCLARVRILETERNSVECGL